MKKLLLLINPNAGKGGYKNGLGDALNVLYKGGYLPTVFFTSRPGEATEIIARNGAAYDMIACMGGDGTLSEVVSGMMALPCPPPLGYMPKGTANDVASTLKLSRDPAKAAVTIVGGNLLPMDVGRYGSDGYFTYIAAFGAFTDVSYETTQEAKQALGHLAYVMEGMSRLPKLTHHRVRVEYDDGVITEDLVFGGVANSTSLAGLVKLDDNMVELGDGLFEVILVRNPTNIASMSDIFKGIINRQYNNQSVVVLHSRKIRFTFDEPVAWTRDGESGGIHRDILLENRKGAVSIMVD